MVCLKSIGRTCLCVYLNIFLMPLLNKRKISIEIGDLLFFNIYIFMIPKFSFFDLQISRPPNFPIAKFSDPRIFFSKLFHANFVAISHADWLGNMQAKNVLSSSGIL